jgi:hypothetical protein
VFLFIKLEGSLGVDLKAQKDEIKTLVHAIMAEQQSAEEESEEEAADEAEEEEDDEGSEDGGAAAAAPKKARKPQASDGPQTSWELSEKLMQFLGTAEAEMDFKKVSPQVIRPYVLLRPLFVEHQATTPPHVFSSCISDHPSFSCFCALIRSRLSLWCRITSRPCPKTSKTLGSTPVTMLSLACSE